MPSPNTKTPYFKPLIENQILRFIKTLGYDEDPKAKMTFFSTVVATRLRQQWRAILSDEFEWQAVDRSTKPSKMSKLLYTRFTKLIIDYFLSCNKNIPRESDSELHSKGDDSPITKLSNTVKDTSEESDNEIDDANDSNIDLTDDAPKGDDDTSSKVKKFCDGTLMKIRDNLIDMVNTNKLGKGNRRLIGMDLTDNDVMESNEMFKMEPDINNMTLNEYLIYEGKHRELERSYTYRISVSPKRNRIMVYPDSDEEDEEYCSLPPLLLCFQTL
uniref:Uncharacterized protein n=1 Tax=Tanacetum cinerariifolium TaxID=118510 RepID=A0A6L2MSE7_TANCI|nr:hypothetical protein [Tanacetum cinerariifolium]